MKKDRSFPLFWNTGISIRSAIFIQIRNRFIPGGPIGSEPGKKNAGWRIDYFCVSERLKDCLKDAKIHTDIMGSDHCPVELDLDL